MMYNNKKAEKNKVVANKIVNMPSRIAMFRTNADMTQEEVARKMGLTQTAVSAWENGTCFPTDEHVHAFCAAVGTSVPDFVLGKLPSMWF